MKYDQAQELLKKLNDGVATAEETQLLEDWLLQYRSNEPGNLQDEDLQASQKGVWNKIIQEQKAAKSTRRLWPRIAAAASVILALGTGGYVYLKNQQQTEQQYSRVIRAIKPGSNGAILTLANGQKIVLEQVKAQTITQQNGASVQKTGDSLLVYKASATPSADKTDYNTLETPKGKQYSVVLPDGSKVWLNAGSSLKYPTAFSSNERLVELTGEAFFEVVHNDKQPFRVKASGQLIEDVGTSFNVNAYSDETATKTTLLQGIVKVNGAVLKPGEQSDGKTIHNVDTEETIAWKNGNFQFDNADVKSVMRQLNRWYDVNIECESNVANVHYTGMVPRRSNIQAVLKMLKETGGTDYRVNGKTIIIINKS